MKCKFQVRRCYGKVVGQVELACDRRSCSAGELEDLQLGLVPPRVENRVLAAAGLLQFVCGGCYDQGYHVELQEK